MARPRKDVSVVRCKVITGNVWTSLGKAMFKDTISLPRDEAQWLESRDQVVTLE